MKHYRYLFVLGIAAFWGYIHAQQIAFEVEYYSFEAIAKALSVGGRQVVCEPTLKQRMALLSLKARDWEAMRQLLQRGLDLEIVCVDQEKNLWRLQRDRRVVAHEKRLRDRFAHILESKVPYPSYWLLRTLPADVSDGDLQALEARAEEFGEILANADIEEDDVTKKDTFESIFKRILGSYGSLSHSPSLLRWARAQLDLPTEEQLRRFGLYYTEIIDKLSEEEMRIQAVLMILALVSGEYRRLSPDELERRALPDDALIRLRQEMSVSECFIFRTPFRASLVPTDFAPLAEVSGSPKALVVLVYNFDPFEEEITFLVDLFIRDMQNGKHDRGRFFPIGTLEFSTDSESLTKLFREMDADFYQAYIEATRLHRQLIQAPCHQISIRAPFPSRGNFYRWLKYYAQQCDQEVIVEVYPQRCRFADDEEEIEVMSLYQIASCLFAEGAWRLERIGEVWVWRNWLAFIDRIPDFALAAFQRSLRSKPTVSEWLQLFREVTPTQAHWLVEAMSTNIQTLFSDKPCQQDKSSAGFYDYGSIWLIFRVLEAIPKLEIPKLGTAQEYSLGEVPEALLKEWLLEFLKVGGFLGWLRLYNLAYRQGALRDVLLLQLARGQVDEFVSWLARDGRLHLLRSDENTIEARVYIPGRGTLVKTYFPIQSDDAMQTSPN